MFGMAKTLIVVYKDEMLMNQLKKLVETNDDSETGTVVGTTDGSINLVCWTEKVWLGNKKAGNIKDKVLFLGDVKGTDKLIPVVDVIFDEFGVKFGWAGNQAILYADTKELIDKDKYMEFIDTIADYPIPDSIKQAQTLKVDEPVTTNESVDMNPIDLDTCKDPLEKKTLSFLRKAKKALSTGADALEKASEIVADKAGEILPVRSAIKKQQLFYGIVNLYNSGLEDFMNM